MAKQTRKLRWYQKLLLGILFTIIAVFAFIYWVLYQNGKQLYVRRGSEIVHLMQTNPIFFNEVFSNIFPKALLCQKQGSTDCAQKIRPLFENHFSQENTQPYYTLPANELKVVGNLPIYFVTLNEDKIVKLFFSGDLKIEPIDTIGERQVRDVLLGEKRTLYGVQLSQTENMTYLKDLYSEAEIIVPYRVDGKVMGAVVLLHGD